MSEVNDGGPAFPFMHTDEETITTCEGMTLRDYFAIRATEEDIKRHTTTRTEKVRVQRHGQDPEFIVESVRTESTREEARYRYADAMLRAREAT